MFKIIGKKKYERKIQLIKEYEEKFTNQENLIFSLKMANENKQGLIDKQNERIKKLENDIKQMVGGKNERKI